MMLSFPRRWISFCLIACVSITLFFSFYNDPYWHQPSLPKELIRVPPPYPDFTWKDVPKRYPVREIIPLPTGPAVPLPRIQHAAEPESALHKLEREERLAAVKRSFLHSWEGYKRNAWLQDEVQPLQGGFKNGFGGWGATLVDSLDTLWILGLKREFAIAVAALRDIDFSSSQLHRISVFETTIRYLGGLLSAYDLSEGRYPYLLKKAVELGEMLYVAFDTPNRMPVTQWDWKNAATGGNQEALPAASLAELGSLSLEFTRLSQLTGDHKYYDAVQRIMNVLDEQQNRTRIPGIWPLSLDARGLDFSKANTFSLGAMADSWYEYLPKQHLLVGGRVPQYQNMYETALEVMKEKLFFRALNPTNNTLLFAGSMKQIGRNPQLKADAQHLTCFVGGMVGLGARAFDSPADLLTARQLTDGCIWAYESMPSGIMPESFVAAACTDDEDCQWDEEKWYWAIREANRNRDANLPLAQHAQKVIASKRLVPGFADITDPRYILRPEAIESVFILYRITGDKSLQDKAWNMFRAIEKHARTDIAYAAISDVTVEKTSRFNTMESFWTAETLKYFYLIFSDPSVVSLDEFVFNTEAHPLRRPTN